MHLHLHLQVTIRDFRSVYNYWLFSFEQYNSILKTIKTNRKTEFELMYASNEPLPPTAFHLAKKPLSLIPTPEYNCLIDYYQIAYNDGMISNCKNDMMSSSFVNNHIEILKSINILEQVYKGCNSNGRGSYIQALFEENCMNAHYSYIGEI
ncbi:hypothetical protein PHYBLDRAFT_162429 [Phycomyces blakesleeanus NRRL 1555(-)]|uniref:Uncharacterized protein n=1 Tax=Phycomyces blakesleeanus (strain ATCC 8743b / DSM 1359 / FGSC 10004 / NBRC 33097 / NRRL 1555) TaxID=763407 RepID=A0A162YA93_PHYB8|nr:hypothetical protein PHYBLDRAFT_162429 [Phycomyces blakesleeanus NRRL 1555(-)]OAD79355.1 hypothetical protein PHYBLDRAFT_162429 [Phycomyces blakesleeanus NRRL 1555(-)]|eukprot:XP_018297395.1 hypothetical protein PHYBLDRAFT_162429 [Phycomyces blakesleeanus NRRL 1555(-)]